MNNNQMQIFSFILIAIKELIELIVKLNEDDDSNRIEADGK